MQTILTEHAPKPAGHYSQGIVSGGFIYVAGQLPIDPVNGSIPDGIAEQTARALKNVQAILDAGGSSVAGLVSVQLFITSVELWPEINGVYAAFMGEHRPARTVVPVGPLHHGVLIEINAVAEVGAPVHEG